MVFKSKHYGICLLAFTLFQDPLNVIVAPLRIMDVLEKQDP